MIWRLEDAEVGALMIQNGAASIIHGPDKQAVRTPHFWVFKTATSRGRAYLFEGSGWARRKKTERLVQLAAGSVLFRGKEVGQSEGGRVTLGTKTFDIQKSAHTGPVAGREPAFRFRMTCNEKTVVDAIARAACHEGSDLISFGHLYATWRTYRWPEIYAASTSSAEPR
ncbi:MAG: hypothetical protein B7733_23200 [Myxococcales bacterium FL481]|nr:MAG: hypothetical protein B7733_23200 [Myxococcales bacterium FL481]